MYRNIGKFFKYVLQFFNLETIAGVAACRAVLKSHRQVILQKRKILKDEYAIRKPDSRVVAIILQTKINNLDRMLNKTISYSIPHSGSS